MADVRSMLRTERQARRLTHPHLAYSTTGQLVCMVCHIQLKTESLWNKHLVSNQHAMRLQRIRDNALGRPPGAPAPLDDEEDNAPTSANIDIIGHTNGDASDNTTNASINGTHGTRKRKADSESEEDDTRNKKSRVSDIAPEDDAVEPRADRTAPSDVAPTNGATYTLEPTVDEDEYAAFERDVATPPRALNALTASATIVAAPLSAAELAAQARAEAQLTGKERREAELEAEKEDAARQMEEELDEMAELEERVRRLREKREAIRKGKGEPKVVGADVEEMVDKGSEGDDEQDEDDDGVDDELDEWGVWVR